MPKVFLGMSGGVDSSVSAILLKEQGYDVTGIYMKNWSRDLPGMKCPWAEDLADAKRVAVGLDLDFEVWDFEAEYKHRVVDYMLAEFQKGRTPNPDIMCNEQIKFKLFYEKAMTMGADYIATGHYARVNSVLQDGVAENCHLNAEERAPGEDEPFFEGIRTYEEDERVSPATAGADNAPREKSVRPRQDTTLLRAKDENKDQTYFLYRMSDEATTHTIFPVGNLLKSEVKALAAERGLDVAHKKESMGVCFVGEVGMKDFLHEYLEIEPGEIRDATSQEVLGHHDGAIFYTIGQRHGLYLGGGLPYYVVDKDLSRNIVYVSRNLNHHSLWTDRLKLEDLHLRNELTLDQLIQRSELKVRLRHRAPLIPARLAKSSKSPELAELIFESPIKRPAAGQSAVFYSGEICLGGGIIS